MLPHRLTNMCLTELTNNGHLHTCGKWQDQLHSTATFTHATYSSLNYGTALPQTACQPILATNTRETTRLSSLLLHSYYCTHGKLSIASTLYEAWKSV